MAAQMQGLDIRILSITILLSLVFLSRSLVDCMFAFNLINEQLNSFKGEVDNTFKDMENLFTNNLKHNDFIQMIDNKFAQISDKFEKFFMIPKSLRCDEAPDVRLQH